MTSFLGWRTHTRKIDELPPPSQPRTIKVLVLGAPRTGTSSMTKALSLLGYKCYEGMGHSFKYENRYPQWSEAIDAKYFGNGTPFTAQDFDKILGGYDMTCSWPSVLFVDELLAAYPDAKVIITNRNVDSWLGSVKGTIHLIATWKPSWDFMTFFTPGRVRDFRRCADLCGAIWHLSTPWDPTSARQHYLDHYDHVRKVVPSERLLEHESKHGWKPLCEFLGKPVPEVDYPRITDKADFQNRFHMVWWLTLGLTVARISLGCGLVAAVLYRQRIFDLMRQHRLLG